MQSFHLSSAKAGVTPEAAIPAASKSPWIYGPVIDLLAGCGAWSAPLLLLAFFASNSNAHGWTVAFYFLALLFNYPHFMATVYRAYHSRSEFEKYRVFTVHTALLLALAGVAAHVWYAVLPWIFTLYICWSPWHYTGQNFGLLMMFARRAGISPTSIERRALRLAFVASFVLLMLSFHTGASGDPLILSLGLPANFTLPARAVLAAFFFVASGWALLSVSRRSGLRATVPALLLVVTQFLWFLLPALIELFSGRDVPQTRYSSGILAVLHSTQYLWITSYYQAREARAAGDTHWKLWRYLVTLFAGGIALFVPGPWIVSRLFHADFTASFLTFTALVNIHHFILDGALWKLRDSRNAQLLLDKQENSAGTKDGARSGLMDVARWLAGPASTARGIRIGAAIVLFCWAGFDQLHFYWSSKTDSLSALVRAAKLNPDDSGVQVRLARAEMLAGEQGAAAAALQRAALVNPGNAAVQDAYGRALIETGRDADAAAQYKKIIERWPRNTDALVNFGLLSNKLGHDDEAIESWQRAIATDPAQANAQLYLAQVLDQRGETPSAARHYHAYLQIVAAHPSEHLGDKITILAALMKVADADAAANRFPEAMQGYLAAIRFAQKLADKTLESLASVHLAELEEKENDPGGAALNYQRALSLDESLSDPRSAASDWVNYGQFLRRQHQPERLVLACFLRAESILKAIPGEELSAIVQARKESEARLGSQAASVQRKYEAVSTEAEKLAPSSFLNPS
jgi:Tfp pilus assembly protein PilF